MEIIFTNAERLTPWDTELFRMVESLTGKPCYPRNDTEDSYFITVDYSARKDPEFISAVLDAIIGRLGYRAMSWEDDPENEQLIIHVGYMKTDLPTSVRLEGMHAPRLEKGQIYCRKLSEVRAVKVDPENARDVLLFVGNGEWEINKQAPGLSEFHFRNAAGAVYCHAVAGSYIVSVGPELFKVVDEVEFEKEFELK